MKFLPGMMGEAGVEQVAFYSKVLHGKAIAVTVMALCPAFIPILI